MSESLYWHGLPPFVRIQLDAWPWDEHNLEVIMNEKRSEETDAANLERERELFNRTTNGTMERMTHPQSGCAVPAVEPRLSDALEDKISEWVAGRAGFVVLFITQVRTMLNEIRALRAIIRAEASKSDAYRISAENAWRAKDQVLQASESRRQEVVRLNEELLKVKFNAHTDRNKLEQDRINALQAELQTVRSDRDLQLENGRLNVEAWRVERERLQAKLDEQSARWAQDGSTIESLRKDLAGCRKLRHVLYEAVLKLDALTVPPVLTVPLKTTETPE